LKGSTSPFYIFAMSVVTSYLALFLGLCLCLAGLLWLLLRLIGQLAARIRNRPSNHELLQALAGKETIGFFHPYCNAGGGGERVLWCAVAAVQLHYPGLHCVIYTGDCDVSRGEMLEKAVSSFGVKVNEASVHFVYLRRRRWVEASMWPRFTLLGQSLGSIFLGWEALCACRPDVFIDTMGYAFTLPLFSLVGRCRIGAYVHYPTISTDMLQRVRSRDVGTCNKEVVARSRVLTAAKLLYYQVFAVLYGFAGRFAEVVMTNSSWTRGHIEALWRIPKRTSTVFPPCDTKALQSLPLERAPMKGGGHLVLSVAQFRPEKDHPLQLRAFARFLRDSPEHRNTGDARVRLVVAGGCRDAGDRGRVEELRELCGSLGLRLQEADVENDWDVAIRTNLPLTELREVQSQAIVGLHTMRDEHFGISVVEFMAAGAIPLAHDSAGPRMDIVTPLDAESTGFLATDEDSYAKSLAQIFRMTSAERRALTARAREAVSDRFSEQAFQEAFAAAMLGSLRS